MGQRPELVKDQFIIPDGTAFETPECCRLGKCVCVFVWCLYGRGLNPDNQMPNPVHNPQHCTPPSRKVKGTGLGI